MRIGFKKVILMNSRNPLVSVITPVYNGEKYVAETIKSVLEQTYKNFELVIVDDASTDDTVRIISEFKKKDSRIRLIKLESNQGAAVARNTAIENSNGQFIAFLDSDDLWLPEKLEKQLNYMLDNDIAFSFTKYVRIKEDGTLTKNVSKAPEKVTYTDLMKHCVIGCLTVMINRNKVQDLQMENIRTRQDYALWLKITKTGLKAYGFPEVLAKYRLGNKSISSNKFKAAKMQWKVYREIEEQSLFKSLYYFIHYSYNGIKTTLKSITR